MVRKRKRGEREGKKRKERGRGEKEGGEGGGGKGGAGGEGEGEGREEGGREGGGGGREGREEGEEGEGERGDGGGKGVQRGGGVGTAVNWKWSFLVGCGGYHELLSKPPPPLFLKITFSRPRIRGGGGLFISGGTLGIPPAGVSLVPTHFLAPSPPRLFLYFYSPFVKIMP